MKRSILMGAMALGLMCGAALADTVVSPSKFISADLHGTITTTNTFQSLQSVNSNRNGCLIQNHSSTNAMWVYFGPIASATQAGAHILDSTHGLQISCSVGGTSALRDQVSITGTQNDAFSATFQ